ncbi:Predicted arabinose efflux permease, MFS family [Thalassobacillus cyri]|uniref:Predicted arabinose efflux permease, MFS family n=1 Tax=Thalassobacillus cyri TaxID=571932 RepID=A0A1H4EZQ6_9BACI|nr:MFS transporter [Thalassobacillus cyri]SEA90565.1 Predicted arabinose efflux permease, MFS family [Thalassobacillus cyri]
MKQSKREPIWTKSFISISLTQFTVFLAFYALLTTLPIYVIQDMNGTEAQGGLTVTAMLVAAILIRPFSGKLIDVIGKKKTLIAGIMVFTMTTFFYIGITEFIPLLWLRLFHGLSFGLFTTVSGAIAADVVPESRRGEGIGYFAMAMNLAVVAGPFIGLTVLQFAPFHLLFILLSVFMVSGTLSAFLVNVPKTTETGRQTDKIKLSLHDLIETKAVPIALISSLVALSYSSILSFLSVYANAIGLSSAASYFFLVFAVAMLLSRPYLGRAFDTKGPRFVILPCLFLFAVGLVFISFTSTAWMLLISAAIIGLGYGTLLPSFQTMAVQSASIKRSGHSTATFFMFYDSGIAAGSFIWGLVVAQAGYQQLYIISAVIVLVVIALFCIQTKKQPRYAPKDSPA